MEGFHAAADFAALPTQFRMPWMREAFKAISAAFVGKNQSPKDFSIVHKIQ
jgi:hypothetical protein